MTDDDLQGRFDALDDVDIPPWRDRAAERLAAPATSPGVGSRSSLPMLAAAIAVVVALIAAGVLLTGDDDEGAVVVDDGGPSAPSAPIPVDDRLLVCPPVLLDISGLDGQPTLAPPILAPEQAEPYVLTFQRDGVDVLLSYPGPFVRTADLPPNETVALSDGRSARLEFRSTTTADVPSPTGDTCSGFWISVPGDARDAVLAIADQVAIRVPEGSTVVPDVVGLGPLDAQDAIARAGLVPAPIEPFQFEPVEPVAAQSPSSGTEVAIGSDVDLVYEPPPSTTAPPVLGDPDVVVPIPDEPIVCPYARVEIDDEMTSPPRVAYGTTLEWDQPDGYLARFQWPGPDVANGNFRDLTIDGRPARMYDGGDGQNLVYDTGLTDGPCRFVEVSVYGGPSIEERERRAEALATDGISFPPTPDEGPPDVVGMSVAAAVDTLARAGFFPDWGARPTLPGEGDLPLGGPESPDETVTGQNHDGDGVVTLTTD